MLAGIMLPKMVKVAVSLKYTPCLTGCSGFLENLIFAQHCSKSVSTLWQPEVH
jgi:hypothetical protein